MRLVELAGPCGVGKTTIYNALQWQGFIPNPTPSYSEALVRIEKAAVEHADIRRFADLLRRIFSEDRAKPQQSRTWRSFAKVAICRERDAGIMVVPGCLVQRGQGLDRLGVPVTAYLDAMPLPDVLLTLEAPQGTIEHRNRTRRPPSDRGHEAGQSADYHALACEVLEKRGARVERIDATRPIEDTAKTIVGLLHG